MLTARDYGQPGIIVKLLTAHYPETDGQIERTNKKLEWYL